MNAPTNQQIADVLERIGGLLEHEDANPFRIRAYYEAEETVRHLDRSIAELVKEDQWNELKALPNIGDGIAGLIGEYVSTGKSGLLQDLEAKNTPVKILTQVPGLGETLANRIVDQIHVETLPELEVAAHDGRLESVEGIGERKAHGIRTSLATMLRQSSRSTSQQDEEAIPSVEMLLDIDKEYRERAKKDELHKIAPRRFNPDREAWLPVMHTKRHGWSFTALFSNTARAHELEKTDDWVVIYYERDDQERQNTVVTETQGPLEGKRVVRGRSAETRAFYNGSSD